MSWYSRQILKINGSKNIPTGIFCAVQASREDILDLHFLAQEALWPDKTLEMKIHGPYDSEEDALNPPDLVVI